jgi:hypothetical protein
MARKDLLSEAIADAKAVKETALANAKLALEEAFTPKLQSMISAKLAEELDDEELEEDDMGLEDELEEDEEEVLEMDDELEEDEEEVLEMDDELEEDEMGLEDELEEDEDELDLESIIRELEMDDELEEDEEEEPFVEQEEEDIDEDEEEVDLAEVIRVLQEMGDEDKLEEDEVEPETADVEAELEEAYDTIKSLQSTINEVNLLNAKLLYTNKLFRTFDLNESQKVKVLENFDRTSSVREVKLVFSTIAENLNVARKKRTIVKEGYASKATKSSAPKRKIISEGNQMAARWKKLAGLK